MLQNPRGYCQSTVLVKFSTKNRFNKYKHKIHPWIDTGILRSIKKRDCMYKKLKKTHHANRDYENLKLNLSTYNRILQSTIRNSKKNYYFSEFSKYSDDIKKTWQTIGTVINRKNKKKLLPSHF